MHVSLLVWFTEMKDSHITVHQIVAFYGYTVSVNQMFLVKQPLVLALEQE